MTTLKEIYHDHIRFALGSFDRVVVKGRIPSWSYPKAMEYFLYSKNIKYFDFEKQFAVKQRDAIRGHIEQIADEAGVTIQYVERKNFRMDDAVEKIIDARGTYPGLVHIFSVKEPGPMFTPWYDNMHKRAHLRMRQGLYLHYYLYFIDEDLGLLYVRVGTYIPCELQIYINGHSHLAVQMQKKKIGFTKEENTFSHLENLTAAFHIADDLNGNYLQARFNRYAKKVIPFYQSLPAQYRWTIWQAEYSYDIAFTTSDFFPPIFEQLARRLITYTKPRKIASFFNKHLGSNAYGRATLQTEYGVICLKFQFHRTSVKAYLKANGQVLRIECTTNDAGEFRTMQPYRKTNGETEFKVGSIRKHISSLVRLRHSMHGVTQRFLDYISRVAEPSSGHGEMHRLSETVRDDNGHAYRGFNLFDKSDEELLRAVNDPSFQVNGFRNKDLREKMRGESSRTITVKIRRMREKGLIHRIPHTRKYYITGRCASVFSLGEWLLQYFISPALSPV
jgi:hypothetical protein